MTTVTVTLANLLESAFPSDAQFDTLPTGDLVMTVAPWHLLNVCERLKSLPQLGFNVLNDLTVVDTLEMDPKKKNPPPPEFVVVYQLSSLGQSLADSSGHSHNLGHRLTLKTRCPRWKDQQVGQLPEIPSVAHIWQVANWHEREAYDLFGILFVGHPNLVRILCPDDWVGHPLRKDYEFPTEYEGITAR